MSLSKQDKKELIRKVSQSSGIAQYAIEAKISDAHLIELSQHLDILQLLKKSNDYNRYCQGQKTAEANAKLKEFMKKFISLENSEIVKTGKWLFSGLSKQGKERKSHLLEKDLVHKEDYNEELKGLKEVLDEQHEGLVKQAKLAGERIYLLERKNDNLRKHIRNAEIYITNNFGLDKWEEIKQYIFR